MSSGRRLFPSRRTITPVLTTLNTNARHCYSLFEVYSSPIKAPQNGDEQLCKDDSPSSTGSVKIGLLSRLDLPPLEAETSSVHDDFGMGSSRSIAKLKFDQALAPPTDGMSPTANVIKSTKQPPQTESLSVLKHHPYDHRSIGDSVSGQDSKLERPNSSVERKPQVGCPVESARSEHHASEVEAKSVSAPTLSLSVRDIGHIKDTVHQIDSWESSVKLCTTFSNYDGGIQINHHARMTVIVPKLYIAAERTKLSITVSNGIRGKHERLLGPGQYSLFFQEDLSSADATSSKEGEIIIVRDTCDLDLPLNLYLTLTYRLRDPQFMVALLPTFRPHKGATLSEVVALTHPSPPLFMKPLSRGDFSTWKEVISSFAQATYLERVNIPRLYPKELKDDIAIKIWTPSPVFFNCLDRLQPCDLVWNFDMTVEEVIGGPVECDMSFSLQVGEADRLVSIDPHGWAPKYFVIDGRLATEQTGEWRENEKGLLTLFKRSGMARGPIRLETHWQEPSDIASSIHGDTLDLPLPRVTDLKVVGGGLTCRLGKSQGPGDPHKCFSDEKCMELLVLGHSGASSGSYSFYNGPHVRLPPMFPGYKLYLNPTSDEHLHHSDSVTEKDHPAELGSIKLGHNIDLGHNADYGKPPPLGHRRDLRPLTDRLSFSPIAEEDDPMELQNKASGGSPKTGDNAQSQVASYDVPNEYPPLARSSSYTLLAIFLTFCLIFYVRLYTHPMETNSVQRGSSTEEHSGYYKSQTLGWYEAGNDSLSGAYMDGKEAKPQGGQRKSEEKALNMPHKNEAERARWEVLRDWLDQVLDGREWQGYG